MKKIVIVGGGLAGLEVAKKLSGNESFQIVLIDKNNYNFFPPLLYQVSTAFIEASNISYPFRRLFQKHKNVVFFMGDLIRLILKMKSDQIISKACPLFRQKGTQGVSTEDIAQTCGISKATLFKLFDSKQVLIERVVEKHLEKCESMLAKQSEFKTSHARIGWLLDCSIQIGELFPAIFDCSLKRYYPGPFMLLDTFIESDLADALLSALETGMYQSIFDPDLNHVRVVQMYLWQIKLAITDSTISEIDRVELYRQLKKFFISGIAVEDSDSLTTRFRSKLTTT